VSARVEDDAVNRCALLGQAVLEPASNVAHRIGTFQARVLLTFFYYVILGPFALVLGRKDPLGIGPTASRGWRPREAGPRPLAEQARRQS
jgi:hypothetical protein